jgi:hypothetical protein
MTGPVLRRLTPVFSLKSFRFISYNAAFDSTDFQVSQTALYKYDVVCWQIRVDLVSWTIVMHEDSIKLQRITINT